MAANMIALGAAYQAGAIAVTAEAIEEAIVLNGVSVTMNTHAFRVGRLAVVDPAVLERERTPRLGAVAAAPALSAEAQAIVDVAGATGELLRLLAVRVPELMRYQSAACAREYVDVVRRARAAEPDGHTAFSEGVARHLFKLMTYKDEYEVARLHLESALPAQLAAEYPDGVTVHYNLHPPFLRALGWQKKIKLGFWFNGAFRLLTRMKGLRGTAFDPFGRAEVRRVERALIGEYRALMEKAMAGLSPESYERAAKLANLPDLIRGYEEVKLRNVQRFRDEVRALGF
jgi:indolepyruvate ferredoxin oxidoreductase